MVLGVNNVLESPLLNVFALLFLLCARRNKALFLL